MHFSTQRRVRTQNEISMKKELIWTIGDLWWYLVGGNLGILAEIWSSTVLTDGVNPITSEP